MNNYCCCETLFLVLDSPGCSRNWALGDYFVKVWEFSLFHIKVKKYGVHSLFHYFTVSWNYFISRKIIPWNSEINCGHYFTISWNYFARYKIIPWNSEINCGHHTFSTMWNNELTLLQNNLAVRNFVNILDWLGTAQLTNKIIKYINIYN